MTSYLRNWLYSQGSTEQADGAPSIETSLAAEDDDAETVHGDDDDAPPAFPAMNSAQRAAQTDAVPRILTDAQLMPPPPAPALASRRPGGLGVPSTSSSSSLLAPVTTTKPPPQPAKRGKVALAPGHGPLDWANLKKSGQDLRVSGSFQHGGLLFMVDAGRGHPSESYTFHAQGTSDTGRCMVRVRWQGLQSDAVFALPPWRREGAYAGGRQGWNQAIW